MTPAPIRLLRSFATVGGWTLASRVLGFARDIAIAWFLGAGPVAEAFFVAFRLPNMFRRLFAEGAFNMAFVPLFAKRLEGDGPAEARRFAEDAMAALLAALLVLTAVAQLAMPWFVLALASGFELDGKLDLAVAFSRVIFPYIIFISLAALYSGILNSFGRFAAAAAAPVLLNVVLITVMGLAAAARWDIGNALSWAVFLAGICQLALVVWAARRAGMTLMLRRPRLTPEVRRLVQLGIPAALAAGVMQINLLVGTQVASYFDGAVGWLWYADRLYQLPLGVVGVAIGVVLLPELSRRVRAGDHGRAADAMNRAAEFCLLLTLPASVALVAIPGLVTAVLFERGAFDAADTAATAAALAVYALGLPAFVLQKVVQPAYFAREDTRTPLRYAVISMLVNVVVAVAGAPLIGFLAAAIGTTAAGWVNLALLWRGMRRLDGEVGIDERLARRAPRMLAAALAMGVSDPGPGGGAGALAPRTAGRGAAGHRRGGGCRLPRRRRRAAGLPDGRHPGGNGARAGLSAPGQKPGPGCRPGRIARAISQPATKPPRCASQASSPPRPAASTAFSTTSPPIRCQIGVRLRPDSRRVRSCQAVNTASMPKIAPETPTIGPRASPARQNAAAPATAVTKKIARNRAMPIRCTSAWPSPRKAAPFMARCSQPACRKA